VTIASLIVDVAANTVKLQKDVEKIHGTLDGIQQLASNVGKALAAAFTVTAVVGAVKQFIGAASELQDLSDRTGIAASSLEKLQLAFEQSGIGLDAVTTGIARLEKALVGGDHAAVSALDKLGLSVEDLKRMAPEDQFLTVADAIGRIQNPTEKAYAAMTIFGKGGQQLLAGLTGHLKETTDEFQKMGLVVDDQTIAAADQFGDELVVVGKQLLALVATIVGPLLPALTALARLLVSIGKIVGDVAGFFINWIEKGLVAAYAAVTRFLAGLGDLAQKVPLLGKHLGFVGDATQALRDQAAAADQFLVKLFTSTDQVGTSAKGAHAPLIGLGDDVEHVGKTAAATTKLLEASALSFKTYKENAFPLVSLMPDLSHRTEEFRNELAGLTREGLLPTTDSVAGMTKTLPGLESAFERVQSSARSLKDFFAHDLGPSILGALQGGGNVLKSIGGSIGGFLTGFGRAIGQSLGKGLTSALGSTIGGALGSVLPGVGTILGSLGGKLVGGLFGKLFGNPEKQINPIRQAFVDAAGGLDALNKKVFEATGSLALVQQLLSAKNPEQYARAVDAIKVAFDKVSTVSGAVDDLVSTVQAAGGVLPQSLQPMVDKLLTMNGLTDDARSKLQLLAQGAAPDFEGLEQKAKGFGISIQELGPAFEQSQIERRTADITGFLEQATKAGGNVGGMLHGLSDEISGVVNDAKKFGVKVPESLHPFIQNLFDTGQLLDENGKKFKDLTGIQFEDTPLDKGTSAIVGAINNLSNILLGLPANAKTAAAGIGTELSKVKVPTIDVPVRFRGGDLEDLPTAHMAAGGTGRVTRPTLFLAGEAGPEDYAFSGGGRSFGSSGGGGDTVVHTTIMLDGRVLTQVVDRHQAKNLQTRRKLKAA